MNVNMYGLRTINETFFYQNPELLGLGRQFGQINFGAFVVFSATLGTVSPLSIFSIKVWTF